MLESDDLCYQYAWFLGTSSFILSSALRFPEWTLIDFFLGTIIHVQFTFYPPYDVHLRVDNNNLRLFIASSRSRTSPPLVISMPTTWITVWQRGPSRTKE
jgi:hypothetical protein